MTAIELSKEIRRAVLWKILIEYYTSHELSGPPVYAADAPEAKSAKRRIAEYEIELLQLENEKP